MRRMVAETRLHPADFILPAFVREGVSEPLPIAAMPGVVQHTRDSSSKKAAVEAAEAGVSGIMLFGVPEESKKDGAGTAGTDPDGILQVALRDIPRGGRRRPVRACPTCTSTRTSPTTATAGILDEPAASTTTPPSSGTPRWRRSRPTRAPAWSASGMMDGQIGVIRDALDQIGAEDVAILAYTAKYASAFYGPFREAVGSSLQGDRRTYQQDPANLRESMRELALDLEEARTWS
ncbi:Delta-aminolevulinic acid dehydratase OS=Streptomyces tendae OX=1932 GN=hemB PE=3 SV=1 [Streptomyces tendae]